MKAFKDLSGVAWFSLKGQFRWCPVGDDQENNF